jgi:hypothetical protein
LWDKFFFNWETRFQAEDFSLIPSIIGASKGEIGYPPDNQINMSYLKDNLFYDFFPF